MHKISCPRLRRRMAATHSQAGPRARLGLCLLLAWTVGISGSMAQSVDPSTPGDDASWLALVDVQVLTMTSETLSSETLLEDQTVLIRGDRIVALGPDDEVVIPSGARRIDGGGRYLVPGLMDLHVHLDEGLGVRPDFADGPLYLAHGVTTVLNLRGDATHLDWRRRIADGEILAPSLFTSGEFFNEPYVTTAQEAEQEVRRQAAAGFDVIKFHEYYSAEERRYLTTVGLSREVYDRMMVTARRLDMPVVGHAPHNLGLEPVLDMGQDLAHLNALVEHYFVPDGTSVFAFFAKLTKWAAWVLMAVALLAIAAAVVGRGRTVSEDAQIPWALSLMGLVAAACFLFCWEHTVWVGSDWLIGILWLAGLNILGVTLLLAGRLAVALFSGKGSRAWLTALLLPCLALACSLAYWLPLAWRNSEGQLDAMAEALHEAEISVITTLLVDVPAWLEAEHPQLRYVASSSGWHDFEPYRGAAPWWTPDLRISHWRFLEQKLVPRLYEAGVPLLLGTDAMGYPMIIPGISVHGELELLQRAGLTPYEALRTATVLPAHYLRQGDEVGSIAPGLRADLLLVEGNPLDDLSRLERPAAVVLRGRWLDGARLDEMLEDLVDSEV